MEKQMEQTTRFQNILSNKEINQWRGWKLILTGSGVHGIDTWLKLFQNKKGREISCERTEIRKRTP